VKITLFIPDDLFAAAEGFARNAKITKHRLFKTALREYLDRHSRDGVTEAVNAALDQLKEPKDEFFAAAAQQLLQRIEEWP
jgi:hypothetical protein